MKSIPLETGLYQGTISYNLNHSYSFEHTHMYLDGLKSLWKSGYKFSNSSQSLYVLQYEDDTWLVSDGPSSCRTMLEFTGKWLQCSAMKCQAMSIEASSGRDYDPKLKVDECEIPFVSNHPVGFLGGTIQVSQNPILAWNAIKNKLNSPYPKSTQSPP